MTTLTCPPKSKNIGEVKITCGNKEYLLKNVGPEPEEMVLTRHEALALVKFILDHQAIATENANALAMTGVHDES